MKRISLLFIVSLAVMLPAYTQPSPSGAVAPAESAVLSTSTSTVMPGATVNVRWQVSPILTPMPRDWVTLIAVGRGIAPQGYGDWQYTDGAASGEKVFTAPREPGIYEFRFYPNNGTEVAFRSQPFMVAAAGSNPRSPSASPLFATEFGIVAGGYYDIPQAERIANVNRLQLAVDKAISESRRLLLPEGFVPLEFTPARRNLRIWSDLVIGSAGRTRLRMGPDNPGQEFTFGGVPWCVWRATPASYEIHIEAGVEADGPAWDPTLTLFPTLATENIPPPARALPGYFHSEGSSQPGILRKYFIQSPRMRAQVNPAKGFHDAFLISPDTAPPGTCWTEFYLRGGNVETLGQSVQSFGHDGLVDIDGFHTIAGWLYRTGERTGYGNVFYGHQGRDLNIRNSTFVTRFGRDCIKYAGNRAEGRGRLAMISNTVMDCARVENLKALGLTTTPADEHWGHGFGWDKFTAGVIANCYFTRRLWIGIQHWGQVNVQGGVFECPYVFGQAGDQTGERPIINMNGSRLQGVRSVMLSAMENALWKFDAVIVDTDKAETLFATHTRPQQVEIANSLLRIRNTAGTAFSQGPGSWNVTNTPILRQ